MYLNGQLLPIRVMRDMCAYVKNEFHRINTPSNTCDWSIKYWKDTESLNSQICVWNICMKQMRANSKETKRSVIFPIVMPYFIVTSFTVLKVCFHWVRFWLYFQLEILVFNKNYVIMCMYVIAVLYRFTGYSLYVSNSSISKTDGYLCYHHEGPGLPLTYQDVNCNHLGQHVIIYNERNNAVTYPATYSTYTMLELCKVSIYGKYKYLSLVFKFGR